MHRGILFIASLALHLVRVLHRVGEGPRREIDEHTGSEVLRPIVGCLAHLTPRVLSQIKLILLEAFLTEGVQAGKGLWLFDSLVTNGTFDQLGNYGDGNEGNEANCVVKCEE